MLIAHPPHPFCISANTMTFQSYRRTFVKVAKQRIYSQSKKTTLKIENTNTKYKIQSALVMSIGWTATDGDADLRPVPE